MSIVNALERFLVTATEALENDLAQNTARVAGEVTTHQGFSPGVRDRLVEDDGQSVVVTVPGIPRSTVVSELRSLAQSRGITAEFKTVTGSPLA